MTNPIDNLTGDIQPVKRPEPDEIPIIGGVKADDAPLKDRERQDTALTHEQEEDALRQESKLAEMNRNLSGKQSGEETIDETKDVTVWSVILYALRLLAKMFRA